MALLNIAECEELKSLTALPYFLEDKIYMNPANSPVPLPKLSATTNTHTPLKPHPAFHFLDPKADSYS